MQEDWIGNQSPLIDPFSLEAFGRDLPLSQRLIGRRLAGLVTGGVYNQSKTHRGGDVANPEENGHYGFYAIPLLLQACHPLSVSAFKWFP